MVSQHPMTITLTHQDDLPDMFGHHPDLMHKAEGLEMVGLAHLKTSWLLSRQWC